MDDIFRDTSSSESSLWDESVRKPQKIADAHLQSPIRIDNRKFLNQSKSPCPSFLKMCVEKCPIRPQDLDIDSENSYGYLFSSSIHYSGKTDQWVVQHYTECADVIAEQLRLTMKEMNLPEPATFMTFGPSEFSLLTAKRSGRKLRLR
jgi:hypothetical protein